MQFYLGNVKVNFFFAETLCAFLIDSMIDNM
jgi:hypothetical protein